MRKTKIIDWDTETRPVIECPECENKPVYRLVPGYGDVDEPASCARCHGQGKVIASCVDCLADNMREEADIISADGHPRCNACAEELAKAAAAVLGLIASRANSVLVDRIASGAFRLASDVRGR